MQVFVRKNKRLMLKAILRPERNLLKHFYKMNVEVSGIGVESRGDKETAVTIYLAFTKKKRLPGDPSKEDSEK